MPFRGGGVHPIEFADREYVQQTPLLAPVMITVLPEPAEADELEDFTSRIMAVRTRDDYERLVGIYGVRRTSDAFWETADWFQDYYAKQEPLLYGILDLNRYANR